MGLRPTSTIKSPTCYSDIAGATGVWFFFLRKAVDGMIQAIVPGATRVAEAGTRSKIHSGSPAAGLLWHRKRLSQ
jgi:hypothetical protein